MIRIRILVCILVCIFSYSCRNNKKEASIFELIDLQTWNAITIATLKDKMQLDTLRYVGDDMPLPQIIDGITIDSFDAHISYILSFREKEIAALLEYQVLSDEKVIYISESEGFTSQGYFRGFTVISYDKDIYYRLTYNEDTHTFSIEEKCCPLEHHKDSVFNSAIEYGRLRRIIITTKITRDEKSQLSYEIISAIAL